MQRSSRITIVRTALALLLTLGVTMLPPSEVFGAAMVPHGAACPLHAGMQKQLPANPAQAPVSHQCCATRQNVAIPSAISNLRPASVAKSKVSERHSERFSFPISLSTAKMNSASPPRSSPLRI